MVAHTASSRARQRLARAVGEKLGGEIGNEAGDIALAEQRRGLAHGHRAAPERLEHQAEAASSARALGEHGRLVLADLDDRRDQQALARDAAVGERAFMRS